MAQVQVQGNVEVKWESSSGTNLDMSAYIDTMDNVGKEVDMIDVTQFSDPAEVFIAGIELSPTITLNGNYEQSGTLTPDPHMLLEVGSTGTLRYHPEGTASGNRIYTVIAIGMSFKPGGNVKEKVGYEFIIQKTGTVVVGTI